MKINLLNKSLLIIILLLIPIINIKAIDIYDTFHLTDKVNGVYITRYNDINSRNGAIYIIKDSSNNVVYCIEPFQPNLDSSSYQGYNNNNNKIFNLTDEQINKINLYANYGYGYNNQTQDKWYIITQALIWREIGLNTYFTSIYHGDKVDMFNDEMNQIINNINNHYIKPSFKDEYNIGINEKLELIDENNVLDNFNIVSEINVEKSNNRLLLVSSKKGKYELKLTKKRNKTNNKTLFYNDNSQNVFLPGINEDVERIINVNVYSGSINVNVKCDNDFVNGAKFNLYDSDNKVIDTLQSNELGNINLEDLEFNKYYIKQLSSIDNCKIDDKMYEIDLSMDNMKEELNIVNDKDILIKNKTDGSLNNNKKNESLEKIINIPNTLSNDINLKTFISIVLIIIGLGVIVLYAKKE